MGSSASKPNTRLTKNHHHHHHHNYKYNHIPPCSNSNWTIINASTTPMVVTTTKALSSQSPLVHHPPSRKGDTHHLVSLTSTTYGSLSLNAQDGADPVEPSPSSSSSADSIINIWELMDGLDDADNDDDFHKVNDCGALKLDSLSVDKKSLCKHLSEESLLSKTDPIVASSYRGERVSNNCRSQDHLQHQIVIYFTSLRGIRKTYEDCCSARMILKSYKVGRLDERDISMDSSYRKELQELVGVQGRATPLPQVFIRGKHIGGADEIKRLNETGELGKLLKGFPAIKAVHICESCGDARFAPCPNCCGSRKVFDEEEDQMRRCSNCNENGLIRCPAC